MKTSAIIKTMIEVEIKAPDGYYILEPDDFVTKTDLIYKNMTDKWDKNKINKWEEASFAVDGRVKEYPEKYLFARKIVQPISMLDYLKKHFIGKECFYIPAAITFPCIIRDIKQDIDGSFYCNIATNDRVCTCGWSNVPFNSLKMKE